MDCMEEWTSIYQLFWCSPVRVSIHSYVSQQHPVTIPSAEEMLGEKLIGVDGNVTLASKYTGVLQIPEACM